MDELEELDELDELLLDEEDELLEADDELLVPVSAAPPHPKSNTLAIKTTALCEISRSRLNRDSCWRVLLVVIVIESSLIMRRRSLLVGDVSQKRKFNCDVDLVFIVLPGFLTGFMCWCFYLSFSLTISKTTICIPAFYLTKRIIN